MRSKNISNAFCKAWFLNCIPKMSAVNPGENASPAF